MAASASTDEPHRFSPCGQNSSTIRAPGLRASVRIHARKDCRFRALCIDLDKRDAAGAPGQHLVNCIGPYADPFLSVGYNRQLMIALIIGRTVQD